MNKLIKSLSLGVLLLVLLSFSQVPKYDFIGTYGVSEHNPNVIELRLNEDHTFTYKDFSNLEKKIDIQGNWNAKNDIITLNNHASTFSFHNKWKIKKNGKVATSRKGMTFYTLMKL